MAVVLATSKGYIDLPNGRYILTINLARVNWPVPVLYSDLKSSARDRIFQGNEIQKVEKLKPVHRRWNAENVNAIFHARRTKM